mmetsp:Transcript_105938/g.309843  ORF Transcript_105938/g.309843 Transcript_105938/m.309843 type:complete len:240 (-) Transcript_105938:121-840(-)
MKALVVEDEDHVDLEHLDDLLQELRRGLAGGVDHEARGGRAGALGRGAVRELGKHHAAEVRDHPFIEPRVVTPVYVTKEVGHAALGLLVCCMLHRCGADASRKALQLSNAGIPRVQINIDGSVLPPQGIVAENLAERALAREGAAADQRPRRRQPEVVGALPPLLQHGRTTDVIAHHNVRRVILLYGGAVDLDLAAVPRVDGCPRATKQWVVLPGNQLGAEDLGTGGDGVPWPRDRLLL